MMYIDAVCKGIDEIPTIDETLRDELQQLYRSEGLDPIRQQLKMLDPVFYDEVDLKNPKGNTALECADAENLIHPSH